MDGNIHTKFLKQVRGCLNMKKTVSVLMLLCFIFGIFTACSNDSAADQQQEEINITVDSHYENMDESSVRAYEKLCQAVIVGESEVKFNTSLIDDVNQLFYTCFPLYPLVESIDILEDASGVSVTYLHPQEEHVSLVNQFFDKIDEIKDACEYDKVSTDRYVFNVYTYLTQNMKIDNSVVTAYDTIMQGKGYSASVCSAFEYLVLQGGGKASHIMSTSGDQGIISMAEFQGTWYYFNPALDIEQNEGKALTGFAMNSGRVHDSQFNYTDETPVDKVEDASFDKLENSVSYTADGDSVNVVCSGEEDAFVLNFN